MRPTRALISINAFLENLNFVRKQIGPTPIIMAVVKANAYGHGLDIIAKAAIDSGEVGYFGVATEEEGVALRKLTTLPIQVLTTALENETETFIANDLDFTVCDYAELDVIEQTAKRLGAKARVHLKVDTGMRRIGVEPRDALAFAKKISEQSHITFVGISTHFASSDEPDSAFFKSQLAQFTNIIEKIRAEAIAFELAHCANSGAILQNPLHSHFDMVRPGIMLYGYAPSLEFQEQYRNQLRPVLDLVTAAGFTKRIYSGEAVSYNLRWKASNDTNIVTVAAGYGDGYSRLLTGKAMAIIGKNSYPVRGTICMDQLMIETGNDQITIGDEVTLISSYDSTLDAWELASKIGTIPYEVLTNITARVPRVVREEIL